ncbi:hypothetical protein GCM10027590_06240 [Nocardiopsis nanhaiensis]
MGPASGPYESYESWESLTARAHHILETVALLDHRCLPLHGVGDSWRELDAALAWAEGVLRSRGPVWSQAGGLDVPGAARLLASDVAVLRNSLMTRQMATRQEMMHRVDQSLQKLRTIGSIDEFSSRLPVEIVELGYVRSLFSWVDRLHWVAQSAHSERGPAESRRLVEAGRRKPLRDLRSLFEYDMIQGRRPILMRGIRDSSRVHPDIIKVTESDSYVASPLVVGDEVVGFVSLDLHAQSGTVDDFDRDLVSLLTVGAGAALERILLTGGGEEPRLAADRGLRLLRKASGASRGGTAVEVESAGAAAPVGAAGLRAPGRGCCGELTKRELQILSLMAEGLSNADLAAALVISEGTAKTHVRNILRKLGVDNRTRAAALYRRHSGDS